MLITIPPRTALRSEHLRAAGRCSSAHLRFTLCAALPVVVARVRSQLVDQRIVDRHQRVAGPVEARRGGQQRAGVGVLWLGKHLLDDMLAEREKLNTDIRQALDAQTDSWGIKVANVEIKQVDLTESMVRAIARQAEAERERRAKVIHAEGELQAAEKLFQAAKILAQEPQAIQLRYLETLTVIGADKNTTVIFPLPMDLLTPFLEKQKKAAG